MTIIQRYQINEQKKILLLALLGISLLFTGQVLFEMGNYIIVKKIPLLLIIRLLMTKIPTIVVMVLPIATLFSTLFALGRLAKDHELMIMQNLCRLNCRQLMLPHLLIAVIVSLVIFFANEYIVPPMNHEGESITRQIMFDAPPPELAENIFFCDQDRFFYVGRIEAESHRLQNVMMYEVKNDKITKLVTAQQGHYQDHLWTLNQGINHEFDENGSIRYETHFDQLQVQMEQTKSSIYRNQRSSQDMNRKELSQLIELLRQRGVNTTAFEVDYAIKTASPWSIILFILLCTPLMVQSRRNMRLFSVGLSIGTVVCYDVMVSLIAALGKAGTLNVWAAAWLPNTLFLTAGLIGLWMADKKVNRL